ncbi:MAG: hypothetical protein DME95_00335, partial [Verrucomicrobia bacterium]
SPLTRAIQFILFESCRSCERARSLLEVLANALEILNGDSGKWRRRFIEILEALLQDRRNIADPRETTLKQDELNGACFARQVQKSSDSLASDSVCDCAWPRDQTIIQTATHIFFMKF